MKPTSICVLSFQLCAASATFSPVWADEAVEPLTLEEAVELALTHNLDIALQRELVITSIAQLLQAEGTFDPEWNTGYTYAEDTRSLDAEGSVAAGGLDTVRSESTAANLAVGGLLPVSTRYAANIRNRSSADTFNDFDEEYTATAGISLIQPLLRGRGPELTQMGIRIASRGITLSELEFQNQVESILLRLEQAYWDLQRAHRDLSVRKKSVEAAESLLAQVEARIDAQAASVADRVQAESGLAQRRIGVLEAERNLELQDRILKDLLLPDLRTATALLDPVDEPDLDLTLPVYEEILAQAEANRPEFEQARLQIANTEDELQRVRNDRLPQLDLEGSLGINGVGGSFGSALDDGREADNNNWSLGVVLRTPWPNRKARAALSIQESELRRELIQAQKTQRQIQLEVDEIYDRIRSSTEQLHAREIAVDFARLSLENEKAKYEVGTATVHDLLLLETELQEAALGLYQATAEHRKHQVTLRRVTGTLLEHWNIDLAEDPAGLETPP